MARRILILGIELLILVGLVAWQKLSLTGLVAIVLAIVLTPIVMRSDDRRANRPADP